MSEIVLAARTNGANPNHHLWNNNGTWWCHYTVHLADFTKRRVRRSLETDDLAQARQRRDMVMRGVSGRLPDAAGRGGKGAFVPGEVNA